MTERGWRSRTSGAAQLPLAFQTLVVCPLAFVLFSLTFGEGVAVFSDEMFLGPIESCAKAEVFYQDRAAAAPGRRRLAADFAKFPLRCSFLLGETSMTSTPMASATEVGPACFPSVRWLVLLAADAGWLWVLMLLTHEVGHGAVALLTGGEVISVELRPGVPGHTLVNPNPQPDGVIWGGFLSGCLLPLGAWAAARAIHPAAAGDLRLLAGFCLLANGVYLAAGGSESLTDPGVLLSLGWSWPVLLAIGVLLAGPGYGLFRRELSTRLAAVQAGRFGWKNVALRWLGLIGWSAMQWLVASQVAQSVS